MTPFASRAIEVRWLAALAALAWVATAVPQSPQPRKVVECSSVVVVRCEPATQASGALTPEKAREREARRLRETTVESDRIVIEADAPRRGVEATIASALAAPPWHGTYTYSVAEGAQCTCMNRCPPLPFPCCQCSDQVNRHATSPGSSPLR